MSLRAGFIHAMRASNRLGYRRCHLWRYDLPLLPSVVVIRHLCPSVNHGREVLPKCPSMREEEIRMRCAVPGLPDSPQHHTEWATSPTSGTGTHPKALVVSFGLFLNKVRRHHSQEICCSPTVAMQQQQQQPRRWQVRNKRNLVEESSLVEQCFLRRSRNKMRVHQLCSQIFHALLFRKQF